MRVPKARVRRQASLDVRVIRHIVLNLTRDILLTPAAGDFLNQLTHDITPDGDHTVTTVASTPSKVMVALPGPKPPPPRAGWKVARFVQLALLHVGRGLNRKVTGAVGRIRWVKESFSSCLRAL